jgi:hypothetical protein
MGLQLIGIGAAGICVGFMVGYILAAVKAEKKEINHTYDNGDEILLNARPGKHFDINGKTAVWRTYASYN